MYLFAWGIDFASFYDLSILFWKYSEGLKFFSCHFIPKSLILALTTGRRGHDRMVVELSTTYVISNNHH
jgi:hypothetical protein